MSRSRCVYTHINSISYQRRSDQALVLVPSQSQTLQLCLSFPFVRALCPCQACSGTVGEGRLNYHYRYCYYYCYRSRRLLQAASRHRAAIVPVQAAAEMPYHFRTPSSETCRTKESLSESRLTPPKTPHGELPIVLRTNPPKTTARRRWNSHAGSTTPTRW